MSLTTADVAELLNVDRRQVSSWFESGQLHGFIVPGLQVRRFTHADVEQFAETRGIQIERRQWEQETDCLRADKSEET